MSHSLWVTLYILFSAYTLWVKDNKKTVKADLKSNASCILMSVELGKRWKSLDLETKQYYCRLAGQKKKEFYSQQNHLPSPSLSFNSLQEFKVPELFYKEATPENTIVARTGRTLQSNKDRLKKEKSSLGKIFSLIIFLIHFLMIKSNQTINSFLLYLLWHLQLVVMCSNPIH